MKARVTQGRPDDMLERLRTATNAHDLEALVDCFAPDYRNETPAHPSRGFQGTEQVRRNWAQIFAAVPDIHADVIRHVVDGEAVWVRVEDARNPSRRGRSRHGRGDHFRRP